MEEMDSTNLYLIEKCLGSIYYLLVFFVIIRIPGWWISMYIKEKYAVKQEKLLEEILKELKEKNKE
jgi:hypothetical protein